MEFHKKKHTLSSGDLAKTAAQDSPNTLRYFNVAIENGPFVVKFPIDSGDFTSCEFTSTLR